MLKKEDISNFTINGLRAICAHNRDIISSYNYKTRLETSNLLIEALDNNHIIQIPKFIYNDKKLIKKGH